ncbi:hypothetical protein FEM48_ZijujUnG0092300 [Ziziphus jujuba var. spinosa]|nr:hypothetical protein FEM48_ZijujUnG0092300 [Ziziphus jujuba var. spinosa]
MEDSVLDLCCGSGDLAFLLSEKVGSQGKVIGLDFSKELLSVASSRQKLLSKPCYENIEWVEGDALDLPFSDGYFDGITMGYGLRNVVDKRRAMQEIFRVLKEGSRVSILDFNKSNVPITALIQVLEFKSFDSLLFHLEWTIDNVVVPVATNYGLADEYRYLKSSINEFLTGLWKDGTIGDHKCYFCTGKELERLTLEVGFSKARHYEISGGFMGNLVATR